MKRLSAEKKTQVIAALVEGCSIASVVAHWRCQNYHSPLLKKLVRLALSTKI
jgi:hypothetical protein